MEPIIPFLKRATSKPEASRLASVNGYQPIGTLPMPPPPPPRRRSAGKESTNAKNETANALIRDASFVGQVATQVLRKLVNQKTALLNPATLRPSDCLVPKQFDSSKYTAEGGFWVITNTEVDSTQCYHALLLPRENTTEFIIYQVTSNDLSGNRLLNLRRDERAQVQREVDALNINEPVFVYVTRLA